jgi:hypothetical protein
MRVIAKYYLKWCIWIANFFLQRIFDSEKNKQKSEGAVGPQGSAANVPLSFTLSLSS